jgi:predicted transposase YbfD/YdcC
MSLTISASGEKSRHRALLEHFAKIEDPREPWRVAHPLPEVLLLVVCGTIADCDDYDDIAAWGEAHLPFLREILPYHYGVPGGRWLTLLMNRIDPALFSACFTAWVREMWPERPDFVAIDGKTSRRSHDRGTGTPPLHLVSAFATSGRLVLGQEAVADKSNELTAIPILLERLGADDGLKGAVVTIDAIACNATIATAIQNAGAEYLLAVKANQPTLRAEIEDYFATAPADALETIVDYDKGHGRVEERTVTVGRETDWLCGTRRFPGELRLPGAAAIIKVSSKTELRDRCRFDTRFFISSATCSAAVAATTVRGHWGIKKV